jgi:hypothetical protein
MLGLFLCYANLRLFSYALYSCFFLSSVIAILTVCCVLLVASCAVE